MVADEIAEARRASYNAQRVQVAGAKTKSQVVKLAKTRDFDSLGMDEPLPEIGFGATTSSAQLGMTTAQLGADF